MTATRTPDALVGPHWSRVGWAVVVGVFLVGFVQGPLATVGWGFTHLPGDDLDGRFNHLVLEHGYRWARGDVAEFWNMPICYPAPRMTAYSDAHLGSLPVYSGLRSVGLSPERSYQVWFLLPFALNYVAAGWAARQLRGGPVAVAVTGFVYAFAATALQFTAEHSQLGPRFLVPPAVLLARGWLLDPTVRRLALLAACLVAQAYLTLYMAYHLGLMVLATGAATAALNREVVNWSAVRRGWWKWPLVGGGAAAALAPLVWPYLCAAHEHPFNERRVLQLYTPTPWAWLLAPDLSWHAIWMHTPFPPPNQHPGLVELYLFPGWLPLIGLPAVAVLVARRPDPPAVLAAAALVLALITTRIGGLCLYDPVFDLPGGSSMRVVARVVLVLLFPAGLGLGFLLEEVARGRRTVGLLFVGLVIADQAVVPPDGLRSGAWVGRRIPVAGVNEYADRLAELVRRERPDARVLCVLPRPTDTDVMPEACVREVRIAWAATKLGIPTVNGYSGYWPHGWSQFRDYDALLKWLPADKRTGLVIVGVPSDADTPEAREARAEYPPLPWPSD